jgi:hypothetical protein
MDRIPVILKQIVADHYRRESISVRELSELYALNERTIESFINTHPLREQYLRIFGTNTDLKLVDFWVNDQLHHYKALQTIKSNTQ